MEHRSPPLGGIAHTMCLAGAMNVSVALCPLSLSLSSEMGRQSVFAVSVAHSKLSGKVFLTRRLKSFSIG